MSAKTTYLENAIINHILRNTAFTSPTETWIALFTAVTDGEAGTVTEVSTGGGSLYGRVRIYKDQAAADAVSGTTPYWNAPSDGAVVLERDAEWAVAGTNWGTITHIGIYDAETAGNLLYYGTLAASKDIDVSDQFVIRDGQLTITEA